MDAAMPINEKGRWIDESATADERLYATFLHLSLLAHVVLSGFAIIVPIIMWVIKKDESPYIADHGREAINFQISLIIYSIIAGIFSIVLIGLPFLLLIPIYALVCMVLAAVAANRGELYRYPMTIRFLNG